MSQSQPIRKRSLLGTYIIGAVPSYDVLDSICSSYKRVFFFVDFNNMIKGLYYPEMLTMILNEIKLNNGIFPSILINEWMYLQDYLEGYGRNRNNKPVHCVYFSEGGQSYYHLNLYKDYKKRRKNALFALPASVTNTYESYDSINDIIRGFLVSSWKWIEIFSNHANILSIRLENLDADFIPELLLRQFDIYDDDTAYVILSSDGDIIQTLDIADNIYIFDGYNVITYDNWLNSKKYITESISSMDKEFDIPPDRIILYKALVGDTSDNIPGIKGIGKKNFFDKIVDLVPNDIRSDDTDQIKQICIQKSDTNKMASKIAHNFNTFNDMIKLVSFKKLIYWLQCNQMRYMDIKKIILDNEGAIKNPSNFYALKNQKINKTFQQNSEFTI